MLGTFELVLIATCLGSFAFALYLRTCDAVATRLQVAAGCIGRTARSVPWGCSPWLHRIALVALRLAWWYRIPQVVFWRVRFYLTPRPRRMRLTFESYFERSPRPYDYERQTHLTAILAERIQVASNEHHGAWQRCHAPADLQSVYGSQVEFVRCAGALHLARLAFALAHEAAAYFDYAVRDAWQDYLNLLPEVSMPEA